MGKNRIRQIKKAAEKAVNDLDFAENFCEYQDEIDTLKKILSVVVDSTGSDELICKIGQVRKMTLTVKDGFINIKLGGAVSGPVQKDEANA